MLSLSDLMTISVLTKSQNTIIKVRFHSNDKPYALKMIKRLNFQDHVTDLQEMFYSSKMTSHPNIIKVLGFTITHQRNRNGETEYCLGILMPLMDRSMQEEIKTRQNKRDYFSFDQLIGIAEKMAKVIQYLHNQSKIAHRDIKPENILIDNKNEIFLADFSDSFLENSIKNKAKTIVGSPYYMSPELKKIFMSEESGFYDPFKSDIFSFAMCLIDIATISIGERTPVKQKLEKIKDIYGVEFYKLLEEMLEEDFNKRKDINFVVKEILAMKNLKKNEQPKKEFDYLEITRSEELNDDLRTLFEKNQKNLNPKLQEKLLILAKKLKNLEKENTVLEEKLSNSNPNLKNYENFNNTALVIKNDKKKILSPKRLKPERINFFSQISSFFCGPKLELY